MNETAPLILVTGSTDGIGLATAIGLAHRGARVVIHGRKTERIAAAEDALRAQGLQTAGSVLGDFADLSSVRAMAKQVRDGFPDLHVLLNNAGVFMQQRDVSVDGHEMTWQVNHLAPTLLTMELLPLLRKNAPSRIVNVASIAHARGSIELADPGGERGYDGYAAYAQSKL
ncbi:MAG: SDR family NAD(P)-dependent oxidoreductase, partial [Bacteroidetes bacterium]|nr:SDR family NAD(P)-dependent oxidoreductase [Bacteroidota bacterium]